MAAHLSEVDSSVSASRNSPMEDDDVVFVESIQPPVCTPAIAEERNSVFASSKHENPQGSYSSAPPPLKDLTSQKGSISETIVIDDEEDTETDGGEEKNPTKFTEWGPPGNKNSPQTVDFFLSSLSRSKTKTGVGPFNPGRMDVADTLHSARFAAHYNPDSWISQSASFPRNQKQQGVDSLSPVASLPKQNFQPSNQHLTKSVNIACANCKKPLQKGQTVYQRKGSAHLFCTTTCLSSFSHKRTQKTRNVTCKKESPMKTTTIIPPVESNNSLPEFRNASLSPNEYYQSLKKEAFTKSRCIMCNKLGEVRHEISVNSITHKICSNNCFNEYRLTNGLIMNCCEQCSKYMPKNTGHKVLITGQQKRFCCQSCANEYKEIMEKRSKLSLLQNRKRNSIREETERKLLESSILSEKIGEIPEKKGKSSEVIKGAAECSLDVSGKKEHGNLPPVTAVPDTSQEQSGDSRSEDPAASAVLSSDPGSWPRILNMKQRDSLVKNDPPQLRNFNFPKDNTGRKFSEAYYTRILPSGEKTTRSWLLYSASKDSVFCLYCRLFGEGKNQLKNENGCKDWQHLSHILGKHEESEMHINNSVKYSKLKSNLNSKINEADIERRFYEDGENGVLLLYT